MPGTYKSWPYTAIVIVPDASIDPKMVHAPPDSAEQMPIGIPELRLIPEGPSKMIAVPKKRSLP
jgi:hypothetical protein